MKKKTGLRISAEAGPPARERQGEDGRGPERANSEPQSEQPPCPEETKAGRAGAPGCPERGAVASIGWVCCLPWFVCGHRPVRTRTASSPRFTGAGPVHTRTASSPLFTGAGPVYTCTVSSIWFPGGPASWSSSPRAGGRSRTRLSQAWANFAGSESGTGRGREAGRG